MTKNSKFSGVELSSETSEKITKWKEISVKLDELRKQELALRNELSDLFFPAENRKEGVNVVELDDFKISLTQRVNRSVDVAAVDAVMKEFQESSPWREPGKLVEYKPSLVLSGYRELQTIGGKELLLFSQAITEKVGVPILKIESKQSPDSVLAPRKTRSSGLVSKGSHNKEGAGERGLPAPSTSSKGGAR